PHVGESTTPEGKGLEGEGGRVGRRDFLDRLTTALARGPHRREQLGERLTARRPDDLGRLGIARRRRRERRERGEVRREPAGRARGWGPAGGPRGQLPRHHLRESPGIDDPPAPPAPPPPP